MSEQLAVISEGIITQLSTDSTIMSAVGTPAGQLRAYVFQAPAGAAIPYILLRYEAGGEENITPKNSFDAYWRVLVLTEDFAQAAHLATHVNEVLHEQTIPYPSPWSDWATCKYQYPYHDAFNIQGRQYYVVGGIYRFRGTK